MNLATLARVAQTVATKVAPTATGLGTSTGGKQFAEGAKQVAKVAGTGSRAISDAKRIATKARDAFVPRSSGSTAILPSEVKSRGVDTLYCLLDDAIAEGDDISTRLSLSQSPVCYNRAPRLLTAA